MCLQNLQVFKHAIDKSIEAFENTTDDEFEYETRTIVMGNFFDIEIKIEASSKVMERIVSDLTEQIQDNCIFDSRWIEQNNSGKIQALRKDDDYEYTTRNDLLDEAVRVFNEKQHSKSYCQLKLESMASVNSESIEISTANHDSEVLNQAENKINKIIKRLSK